jgi:hypothetical protein
MNNHTWEFPIFMIDAWRLEKFGPGLGDCFGMDQQGRNQESGWQRRILNRENTRSVLSFFFMFNWTLYIKTRPMAYSLALGLEVYLTTHIPPPADGFNGMGKGGV